MHVFDLDIEINKMLETDLSSVVSIERNSYDYPWNENIFRDCLLSGYTCVVAKKSDLIVGYAILSSALDEAHILNFCIDKGYRNLGFGHQLLDFLINQSKVNSIEKIFLEVRPSNIKAIALYIKKGFEKIAKRPSYYRHVNGREDADVYLLYTSKIGYLDIQY
ncbi:ribosomal protein S18-alanine N-acetyltransferase [Woeseiaceae bacterium]|jgi:[ribosomal protein S18]-alanine N-acetyltransferase|nr:ribosomal protein S18-alanine N-acetyltransferase [Woeseiaceae bacterium]MDB2543743.1 ribosomal protein S18-alanine N-acetyltransferase [Woeseiaceae bacterium]|tara:strand:- start:1103 stop:1591 length:489 start_codon:yes stop_codon:yes gene_type:complete